MPIEWDVAGLTGTWVGSITFPAYSYATSSTAMFTMYGGSTSGTINISGHGDGWYDLGTMEQLYTEASPVYSMADVAQCLEPVTAEQRRALDAARNEARRQRDISRTQAISRAEELLLSLLSENQRQQYRLTGIFEVIGSAGTLYRIERGTAGNIVWIKPDGEIGGRLCAHPEMRESWLPVQDVAVAQLLALTTDEKAFVRVANVHEGRRPPILSR